MKRCFRPLAVLIFCGAVAENAYAACSTTVSISVAPPTLNPGPDNAVVTITYAFTGSTTGGVALENWQSTNVSEASGTIVFNYPMGCKTSGEYLFRAIATPTGPGCDTTADRATAEATITVDAKPTIHASAIDLVGAGEYTLLISADWAFPLTGTSSSNRHIKFFVDGIGVDPPVSTLAAKQGSGEFAVTVACLATGNHQLTARATSCPGSDEPNEVAMSEPTNFAITAAKVSGVSFTPGPGNAFTATVGYAFEATTGSFRRRVTSTFDGQGGPSNPDDLNASGTTNLTFNGCRSAGEYPVSIYAIACPGVAGESARTDRLDTFVKIPIIAARGTIDVKARYDPSTRKAYLTGSQTLPTGISSAQRIIRRLAATGEDGQPIEALVIDSSTVGTGTFAFGPIDLPTGARQFQFEALLQFCNGEARNVAAVDCSCDEATEAPVYLSDGNMRYSDGEPLPAQLGRLTFARTYDSHHRFRGSLGRGWWSMFDRRLTVTPSSTGETIALTTDNNESVVFVRDAASSYTQYWPRNTRSLGTLVKDSSAQVFRYRGDHGTSEHLFRISDGRYVGQRDLGTDRQMTIAYDSNGLPSSVTDSWTGLTWTIATDATKRRITSITSGDNTWTYQYDANDNLTTVLAPGATAWRAYEHVNDLHDRCS